MTVRARLAAGFNLREGSRILAERRDLKLRLLRWERSWLRRNAA